MPSVGLSRVNSAPNCSAIALTSRVPSRLQWSSAPMSWRREAARVPSLNKSKALIRFAAFHHMKFDTGGDRTRWRDVNRTQQKILKIEREKPDNFIRHFFLPTNNLMSVRKISFYLPSAFSVLRSKCRPSWVLDYFEDRFIDDLKSIAYNRCFEISAGNCYFLGTQFWQSSFCGKGLVAINRHSRQRFRRALRVDKRGHCQQEPKTECFHLTLHAAAHS